jgi:lysylphosphatidylglycerol synthetase-like protein (DUF2156 family)
MSKQALIIYYILLLIFVGLISLPAPYTSVLYGQYPIIIWSVIILLLVLPIYLLVLIIYGLRAREFKPVLLMVLVTILLVCIPYFCYGKLNV